MLQRARIATRPMRAVKPADLEGVYTNPRAVLAYKARKGEVHKVARGVFVAVPDDAYDPMRWRPAFEAAAGAVGTALFPGEQVAAMGLTAARLHRALHRARACAVLAAPRRHRDVRLIDRRYGVVQFVPRDLDELAFTTVRTELGPMLVTTAEQTVLDLARVREADQEDACETIGLLLQRGDWNTVEDLAAHQRGGKTALARLRAVRKEIEAGPSWPTGNWRHGSGIEPARPV
ncbi:MAG: hypothetical protein FWF02_02395 [Micrococcales bacterium]|nr:hypothetical protein [Micrococcales bacterium]